MGITVLTVGYFLTEAVRVVLQVCKDLRGRLSSTSLGSLSEPALSSLAETDSD